VCVEREKEGGWEGGPERDETNRNLGQCRKRREKREKKENHRQPPERDRKRERMHDGNRAQKWGKHTVEGERKEQERTNTHTHTHTQNFVSIKIHAREMQRK
jgi:hypothetical protein